MLKVLIKKQMTEIFRSYFYDAKKNRARSRATTIAYMVLFVLLMAVFLGGMFTILCLQICEAASAAGMSWFYFALTGLIAVLLGTFGSVFNTYSGLYCSKDNDLLLSMPIPVRYILVSRLIGVYLMGLMYSSVVLIPAVIVYWVVVSCTVQSVVGGLLFWLALSVFILTLSCALGWVVARISVKLKNRSFAVVALSLLFIGLYYLLYFRAQELIADLVQNIGVYGEKIKASAYPVYLFGQAGTGDPLPAVLLIAVVAVLFLLVWMLLSRSFLKIATATGKTERRAVRTLSARPRSVSGALLFRELRHFVSSPGYMLNCGLGMLMLVLAGIALLLGGNAVAEILNELFDSDSGAVPVLLCSGICIIVATVDITPPSVSLEGKTLWLVRSLPVTSWQVLRAKLVMQLWLAGVPALFALLCLLPLRVMSAAEFALLTVQVLLTVLLFALFGLFLGIKMPNLTWTNEIVPIKQSGSVMFSLLGGFVYAALYPGVYFIANPVTLGFCGYTGIFAAATLGLCALFYHWLKNEGCRRFEAL